MSIHSVCPRHEDRWFILSSIFEFGPLFSDRKGVTFVGLSLSSIAFPLNLSEVVDLGPQFFWRSIATTNVASE